MRVLAILLFLLLPGALAASETPDFSRGRLWRIETADGKASYLFGTMHISHPAVTQQLPKAVLDAFSASHILALEVNLLRTDVEAWVDPMVLPTGQSLSSLVGAELAREVKRALAPLGFPPRGVERMTPWAASMFLATSIEESVRQKVGMKPLDLYLQLGAERAGMRIVALESLDDHMAAFTEMPVELQASMLRASLATRGLFALAMEDMLALYLEGDLDGLYAYYVKTESPNDPVFFEYFNEAILLKRNRGMVESAKPLLAEGGAFIAIGAMHLAGPDSMLELLYRDGYRVTRAD
ncbi:MAG TPA: TraB/GumN family protein [Kiloniellales bacterium]|nr:TraB/GumN family protein [Kiloniellales bacterium]